jgi:phosphoribosyl-AMP cyclohydrolase
MSEGLDRIKWDEHGLVAAVAQESATGRVLMLAWMNRESLQATLDTGFATYWSRSRSRLWRKGEESGHFQRVSSMNLDCDGDALVLQVEQEGGIACHTGRHSCFYLRWENGKWIESEPVIQDPSKFYPAP